MYVTDTSFLIDPSSYKGKHGYITQCSATIVNPSSVRIYVYTVSFYICELLICTIRKHILYFALLVKNASLVLKNKPTFKQINFFSSYFKVDIFLLCIVKNSLGQSNTVSLLLSLDCFHDNNAIL